MPTGLTFITYQTELVTQLPSLQADANFVVMLPGSIDYAELTIYRDLDFLNLHGNVAIGSTTAGTATYTLPTTVVVLEQLFYGTNLTPVLAMSLAALRSIYASASNGPPEHFAVIGSAGGATWVPGLQILLGPAPDLVYTLTGYGTERQAPLSATNQTTFISQNLPDLFWAAAMIYWSKYLKDHGAEPPMNDQGWEQEYQRILKSSAVEEARKKFTMQGWQQQRLAQQPMMMPPGGMMPPRM
jgi:hypothetical protein